MIPKISAKGTSFKGLAAYLLHDKGHAATSGRVAWVETVNLATPNPQAAWRVMAATAMQADRLKTDAGVKKTGRSSKDAVLHVSLSWDPSQKPTRAQMSEFAVRAIKALKAANHQAMVICHTDTPHPHLHLIINRVSPLDGRLLPSSNEKMALSKLALAYEKETGAVLCKKRAANMAKREKGEYVRGQKDIPRPEFEAMREAQKEAEQQIPAAVFAKAPDQARQIRMDIRTRLRVEIDILRNELRPKWRALYQRQAAEVGKAQQQKSMLVARMRSLLMNKDKAGSPALPFQRQNFSAALGSDQVRAQKQRGERLKLNRSFKDEFRGMFDDVKAALQLKMRQLFVPHDRGGAGQQFAPAAAGQTPQTPPPSPAQPAPPSSPPLTDAQRYRSEMAKAFAEEDKRKQKPAGPSRAKDKDRDWEPEL